MDESEIKELQKKQEEILALVKKLWQAEKWRRFWTIFKYIIYLGVILGAFYFLTPYVEKFFGLFQQFQNIKSPQEFQNFLNQLQK